MVVIVVVNDGSFRRRPEPSRRISSCSPHCDRLSRFHKSSAHCSGALVGKPPARWTRVISNAPPLQYDNVKIQVVATKPSLTFFNAGEMRETGTNVWVDEDEWDVRIHGPG